MFQGKLLPLGVLGLSVLVAVAFVKLPPATNTAALSENTSGAGDALPEMESSAQNGDIKIIVISPSPSLAPESQPQSKVYYTGISVGSGGPASVPLKTNEQTGVSSATLPALKGENYNIAVKPPAGTEIKSITCNNGSDSLIDVKAGSTCAVHTKKEEKAPGCGLMPNSKLCGGTCPDPKTQTCGKNKDGQCDCMAKPEKKCGAYLTPSGSKCEGNCDVGKCTLSQDKKTCKCIEEKPEPEPEPTPEPLPINQLCSQSSPGKCSMGACPPRQQCSTSKNGKNCECQKITNSPRCESNYPSGGKCNGKCYMGGKCVVRGDKCLCENPPPKPQPEPEPEPTLPPPPPASPSPEPEPPKPALVPKAKCVRVVGGLGICKMVLSSPETEDECVIVPIVSWLPQFCVVKK